MAQYLEQIQEVGRPVEIGLVESCAAGASECKFVVHLAPTDAPQITPIG